MALSDGGKLLVVCSPLDSNYAVGIGVGLTPDNRSAGRSVAAFTYTRAGNSWNQAYFIKSPYPVEDGLFGGAFAMTPDGATLAIGSTGESSGATGVNGDQTNQSAGYGDSGAAFIY